MTKDTRLEKIKSLTDCRDLIKEFGINLRNGQNISCLNPSHPDQNPSMAVYKEHAYCFGCGHNLDAIGIVQQVKNINFKEACEYFYQKYNMNYEYKKESIDIAKKQERKNINVKTAFWEIIKNTKLSHKSIEFLEKRKIDPYVAYYCGCRDLESVQKFVIDFIQNASKIELQEGNFLNSAGKLWSPLDHYLKGNQSYLGIIIPIFEPIGNIHSFRWRLHEPIIKEYNGKKTKIKVYGQPSMSLTPIGLNHAKELVQKNTLYLCEGEPDYLSLKTILKDKNDCSVLGFCGYSNEWNSEWTKLLSEFQKIYICLHDTEKSRKISNIIQCEIINNSSKKDYWKNNFFEYYFDEKNDINDLLMKNEFYIEKIHFKTKEYQEEKTELNNLENYENDSSFVLEKDWIFKNPDKEKSVLNSNYGELVIPQGDVGLFVAAGGTGKTQLLMQLVTALSTGTKWLDNFTRGDSKGKICYVFGEENMERIQRRFQKIFNDLKLSEAKRKNFQENCCFLSLHKKKATFSNEENSFQKRICQFLKKHAGNEGWSLIILDPASRFLPKDAEIDNESATAFIRECEKLSDLDGNPTILIAHHVNKSSMIGAKLFSEEGDSNQSASRGASGLVDGARFVINVDTIIKEDWLKNTEFRDKKLIKIKHSKINCGPIMQTINAVLENNGIIYSLHESDEEELKQVKNLYNKDIATSKKMSNISNFL